MDLDQLLDAARPPVATRTPTLERELRALVCTTERAAVRRGRPRRIALVAGGVAGALALGATASATGVLPGWPGFTTGTGDICRIELHADPLEPGDGEPISATFTPAQRSAALAEARAYLDAFDYDAVDRDEAVAWWRAEEQRVRSAQPDPAERQPLLTGNDLEVTAVSQWVLDHLRSHLAAEGLDIAAVGIATTWSGCAP